MMMMMQASPALVSLTVIAVPGCTVENILLTISLSACSGGVRGAALPLSDVDSSVRAAQQEEIFMEEDRSNGSRITRTETQASGGSKEGVVRYVLIAGLALVIIGFIIAYLMR